MIVQNIATFSLLWYSSNNAEFLLVWLEFKRKHSHFSKLLFVFILKFQHTFILFSNILDLYEGVCEQLTY